MENNNEYNPLSYDNYFFKYLESKGVHPVEFIDILFNQKKYLISKLASKLTSEEMREVFKDLEKLRHLKWDK